MVDGCCATIQKWLIFIINFVLFLFGAAQIGVAVYIMYGDGEGLGWISDLMDGNDTVGQVTLAFGVVLFLLAFLGCCGAKRDSRSMLWIYAIVLYFMLMGQAMVIAIAALSSEYGEAIFQSMWEDLDDATITDIEDAYECCSFNGDNENDTTTADVTDYEDCSTTHVDDGWGDIESCWTKFSSDVEDNYMMIVYAVAVAFAVQVMIYFSTHYLMQEIAEDQGELDAVLGNRGDNQSMRVTL